MSDDVCFDAFHPKWTGGVVVGELKIPVLVFRFDGFADDIR